MVRMRNLREYLVADSADAALRLLQGYPGPAAFIAGGTHLTRGGDPGLAAVVDLLAAGLDGVERRENSLWLGATLPIERLHADPHVRQLGSGVLAEAAARTRTPAWRGQATLGGRLRESDPGDLITAALLVLDARVEVQRAPRTRPVQLALADALREDTSTLFLGVDVPVALDWRFVLEAVSLTKMDAPVAAVIVGVQFRGGRVIEARVATVGLGPAPERAPGVEAGLMGLEADCETFAALQDRLLADMAPSEDHRATREYREHLGLVLLGRALRRALQSAPVGR